MQDESEKKSFVMASVETHESYHHNNLINEIIKVCRLYHAAIMIHQNKIAKQFKLNLSDMRTLEILMELGPVSPGHIGRYIGLLPGSVSTLLNRLKQKGVITRTRDSLDQRRVIVQISAAMHTELTTFYDLLNNEINDTVLCEKVAEDEAILTLIKKISLSLNQKAKMIL
jgi:DNA-binding MarR family transcriptional regulator